MDRRRHANWQPNDFLSVTPFWSAQTFRERGHRAVVFIGNQGFPSFRSYELQSQPWTKYQAGGNNFGAVAKLAFGKEWLLSAGAFRSANNFKRSQLAFLFNTDALGNGDYAVTTTPRRSNISTSGEVRLSKVFSSEAFQNRIYLSAKGRDAVNEFGGGQTINFGRASTRAIPLVPEPAFNLGPTTKAKAHQVTPGFAYEGIWKDVGQVSLGVQKTFYRRTIAPPAGPAIRGKSSPGLYNIAAAAYVSKDFSLYGSYTRGFEEVGNAPLNAANRDEAAPAQVTSQVDAGMKYQITRQLQFVGGVFQIEKPYFNLDTLNFYRRVGTTRNRGAEFSLAGNLSERLTVVAGLILIDPEVQNDLGGASPSTTVAVGPVPNFLRANFQYRPAVIEGLTFDGRVERTSKRYANTMGNQLPAVTLVDAGVRYTTRVFDRFVRARLQASNLTNAAGVTVQASGQLMSIDGRRIELSLAVDF